jgi:deoxyribose-phosphate aldolase
MMTQTVYLTRAELARMIDHTLLTPEATEADVARHCLEANLLGVHAVCLSPSRLPLALGLLAPEIAVDSVVGFPSGAHRAAVKAAEAAGAVAAVVGGRLGIKASGGIHTADAALAMIAAGATRIGASSTAAILDGLPAGGGVI